MMKSLSKYRQKQLRNRKIKTYLYWGFIAAIIVYTFLGTRYNLITYWQTRRANRNLRENLERFSSENEKLRHNIEELRNNPEALERLAREKANMKYKDEMVIRFEKTE